MAREFTGHLSAKLLALLFPIVAELAHPLVPHGLEMLLVSDWPISRRDRDASALGTYDVLKTRQRPCGCRRQVLDIDSARSTCESVLKGERLGVLNGRKRRNQARRSGRRQRRN